VRICANKVVAGVRVSTPLLNLRHEDTRQFASAQEFDQLEGLALFGASGSNPRFRTIRRNGQLLLAFLLQSQNSSPIANQLSGKYRQPRRVAAGK
jgi:hypothetical protein